MLINKNLILSLSIVFLSSNIAGCTMVKEMFFSDISKELCEQKDWSAVGAFALDQGNNLDSFTEYQSQCKKYFSIIVPNNMIVSFNEGYEKARPSYCTIEKANAVAKICGFYNVHACKGIVSEDLLIDLFNAFQDGNDTCVSNAYSNGEFSGRNSATCL